MYICLCMGIMELLECPWISCCPIPPSLDQLLPYISLPGSVVALYLPPWISCSPISPSWISCCPIPPSLDQLLPYTSLPGSVVALYLPPWISCSPIPPSLDQLLVGTYADPCCFATNLGKSGESPSNHTHFLYLPIFMYTNHCTYLDPPITMDYTYLDMY